MATFRFSAQIIGRAAGRSAVAAAAYRAGQLLLEHVVSAVAASAYRSGGALGDEAQGVQHDFSAKRGVVHSEIVLPADAPPWMNDRERLWNAVEAAEKRKDAQLAREVQLGLPRELGREAQIGLVREFVTDQFVARGMVADFAIHDVKARDGGRQPHAHVMLTFRRIDPDSRTGLGLKETAWNRKELLLEWREAWADHVNRALELAAVEERVDHRTLEAQRQDAVAAGDFAKAAELDREPEPKVGREAWALERGGIRTDRGDMLREVQELNEQRRAVYAEVSTYGEAAQARFLAIREQAGDAFDALVAWGEERVTELRAFARGAMVAAGIGAAVLGLAPERDSFQPSESAVTATASVEEHAMDDDAIGEVLAMMEAEDREAAQHEAATRDAVEGELPEAEAWADGEPDPHGEPSRDAAEVTDEEMDRIIAAMEEERAETEQGLEIGD